MIENDPARDPELTKHWGMPIVFPMGHDVLKRADSAAVVRFLAQVENDIAAREESGPSDRPAAGARVLTLFLDPRSTDRQWLGVCEGAAEDFASRFWRERESINIVALRFHGKAAPESEHLLHARVGKFVVLNCSGSPLTAFAPDPGRLGVWQSGESISCAGLSPHNFAELCRDLLSVPDAPTWTLVVTPEAGDPGLSMVIENRRMAARLLQAARRQGIPDDFRITVVSAAAF